MIHSVSTIATLLALATGGVLAQGCGRVVLEDVADGQAPGVVADGQAEGAVADGHGQQVPDGQARDVVAPSCPAGPPSAGQACVLVGQECLYSAAGGGYCGNVDAICSSGGYWQSAGVQCPIPGCPTALPGDGKACGKAETGCIYAINASVCSTGECGSGWTCGQIDCESAAAGVCSAIQCGCESGVWRCSGIECEPLDSGTLGGDAESGTGVDAPCVDASAGASCTQGSSAACNQPANPCAEGFVWACDNSNGTWIKETIACFADSSETTPTSAGCGPGEVLYVDDAAGDPCSPPDGGSCGDGGYLVEPDCCYHPTDAYCVPAPGACEGGLACSCANAICESRCRGGASFGVICSAASSGVVDCLCGKL
jgi:hypothetical protein